MLLQKLKSNVHDVLLWLVLEEDTDKTMMDKKNMETFLWTYS